jgi:hypothetical protein
VRRAATAASSLDPARLSVVVHPGEAVEVIVTYRSPTSVPLVGALVGDVTFTERLVGRAEGP